MPSLLPVMKPAPGERLVRFVGDSISFMIQPADPATGANSLKAVLRTNIGRAKLLQKEVIEAHTHGLPLAGGSWRDLPMKKQGEAWSIELPLAEPGFFRAKGYLVDKEGWQRWPDGPDIGISVHPNAYRTGNTIYCAFTRLFGATRSVSGPADAKLESTLSGLEQEGYAVLPPSGT